MNDASFYHRLYWRQQPAYSRAIPLKYNLKLTCSYYNSVNRKSQVKYEEKSVNQYFLILGKKLNQRKQNKSYIYIRR